jgi:hypothetical protein
MIEALLAEVRRGESEAALTLGLLLERGARGPQDDDEDIVAMLPPEYADTHLDDAQRDAALSGLIAYVDEEPQPQPMAVWALTKAGDERVVPALLGVLERTVEDPDPAREHLAYQALTGVIPFGGPQVLDAVRHAAEHGHDRVRDGARQYLKVHDKPR